MSTGVPSLSFIIDPEKLLPPDAALFSFAQEVQKICPNHSPGNLRVSDGGYANSESFLFEVHHGDRQYAAIFRTMNAMSCHTLLGIPSPRISRSQDVLSTLLDPEFQQLLQRAKELPDTYFAIPSMREMQVGNFEPFVHAAHSGISGLQKIEPPALYLFSRFAPENFGERSQLLLRFFTDYHATALRFFES